MSADAAVRLRQLTKRFGAKTAVDGVSLTIASGSTFGLIGPNGAGKTTTFSMIAGYLRPTDGSVEVLGQPPSRVDSLRARMGVLPQDALLPGGEGVGDFLVHLARLQDVPASAAKSLARRALAEVDGADWWDLRCGRLSHGMAKRVSLAQAFLGEPQLVLLDEPTAGLDPKVSFEVRQLIKAKRGCTTVVISSHNLHELEEICDSAAILDRGRLMASGSMIELTSSSEEIRILVGPGTASGPGRGQISEAILRALPHVTAVHFDDEGLQIVVRFDPHGADAETVIGRVLTALLQNDVRISGVTKGRGLERRVMDLSAT